MWPFKFKLIKINKLSLALMVHTCNPRYSGGRDQEDCSWKPTVGKQFARPYLKKTLHKRIGRVAQGEDPKFKPQYCKKKKN
jgi:hypothetical protein